MDISAAAVRGWPLAWAPSRTSLMAATFVLALVPRLAILAVAGRDGIQLWEYDALARSIADGHGYAISHFGHLVYAFGDGNLYSFVSATVYILLGAQPWLLAAAQAV